MAWVNGPFHAGKYNDLVIAQRFGFVAKLQECGEKCVADSIYKDEDYFHLPGPVKTGQSGAMNRLRARQEYINGRLKTWGCLGGEMWRHEQRLHAYVVRALLQIMQLEIDFGQFALFDCGIKEPQARDPAMERKRKRQVARFVEEENDQNRRNQRRRQRR